MRVGKKCQNPTKNVKQIMEVHKLQPRLIQHTKQAIELILYRRYTFTEDLLDEILAAVDLRIDLSNPPDARISPVGLNLLE